MSSDPSYPDLQVTGEEWALADESVDTLFQLPAITVRGATRQYEDVGMRDALREVTSDDIDHKWRFIAGTRLSFSPGLPPGTLPASILPTVRSEARRSFKEQIGDRGVENVQKRRRERMRVGSGNRARLTSYDGAIFVDGTEVPVTGWVGVWHDRPDFFVVTGGYPAVPLSDVFDVTTDDAALQLTPTQARDEFFSVLRDVR